MHATYTQGKKKIGQKKGLGGIIAKGAPKGRIKVSNLLMTPLEHTRQLHEGKQEA
jgi:hypothetical protein